jgi:hypothetical protein
LVRRQPLALLGDKKALAMDKKKLLVRLEMGLPTKSKETRRSTHEREGHR